MTNETLCVLNNFRFFSTDRVQQPDGEGWTVPVLFVGNCEECMDNTEGMLIRRSSTEFECPSCENVYKAVMHQPSPDDDVRVTVFLSDDFRETSFGWIPDTPMTKAIEFWTPRMEPRAACEVAFAVCNSYPARGRYSAELHCDGRYAEVVERYRTMHHAPTREGVTEGWRSLSVGDVIELDTDTEAARFTCDPVGFSLITPARVRELRQKRSEYEATRGQS